jgi:hypothetical protein
VATDDTGPDDSTTDGSTADGSTGDGSTADESPASDSTTDESAADDPIPNDPTPEGIDEPEAELLPDDPASGIGPSVPRLPDTASNDVPSELKKQFWKLVLLFNVALFGMSLGVMLVGFEGRWRLGGAFFLVGAVAFARGWLGYKDATSDS